MSTDDSYRRPRGRVFLKVLFLILAVGAGAFGAIAISRSDLLGAKSTNDDTSKSRQRRLRSTGLPLLPVASSRSPASSASVHNFLDVLPKSP